MPNLMQRGQEWLAQQMLQFASVSATYRRGNATVPLTVVVGRKDFQVEAGDGRLYFRAWDWLIDPTTLILNGVVTLPERGDQVMVDLGHGSETFLVLPEAAGPAWEWSDPYQSLIRVHTQKVA